MSKTATRKSKVRVATCGVLMRRVPTVDGIAQDRHAHLQLCGRPVERDGMCAYHLRHEELSRDESARWRRALRLIRRG
jgi:hypothetical protein